MADHEQVRVRVRRDYPRGGRTYRPGAVIEIPDYAVAPALAANPPFVELVGVQPVEVDSDFDATEGALDLARAHDFDLAPFGGQGSGPGGRIWASDVKRWLGIG